MTIKQIEAKQMKETLVFEAAKKIRALLDEARMAYGAEQWDEDDRQQMVLELVTEEVDEEA